MSRSVRESATVRSGVQLMRILEANPYLRVTLCHGDRGSSAHLTDMHQSALREIRHEAVNVLLRDGKLRPTSIPKMIKGWLYYGTARQAADDIERAQRRRHVDDAGLMNDARVECRALASHLEIRLDTIKLSVPQLTDSERGTLKELLVSVRKLTSQMETRYAFQEKDMER